MPPFHYILEFFFSSSNSLFLDLRLKASPMGIAAGSSNGFSQTPILKDRF
ncbi:hypothetical protein HanOQP8_Chr12g0448381 [Helianthus annuus]|nr:hypothetical protein HanOQP8_Chr12g0448381 [Helianthus annuus]